MSLLSQIQNSDAPLREWMATRLPYIGQVIKTLRVEMPSDLDVRTIRPIAGNPPTTLGIAIDYRIRYRMGITPSPDFVAAKGAMIQLGRYLAEYDPDNIALDSFPFKIYRDARFPEFILPNLSNPGVAQYAPSAFFWFLWELTSKTSPVGRTLDVKSEERLSRACAVLALYDEVFRNGDVWPTSPLASVSIESSAEELMAIIPNAWVKDIAAVCTRLFAEVPLVGRAVLNPKFALSVAIGGADADFILDGCLVDIKSTVNPKIDIAWLRQVLGYTLLDTDDAYGINSVGILLSRQGVMTRWPLEPLLDNLAGPGRTSLKVMRSEIVDLLADGDD